MMTLDIKAKDLYSNRYASRNTPDLADAFRRRLYLKILADFRLFKHREDAGGELWQVTARLKGVHLEKESGARYLLNAYQRLTGYPTQFPRAALASDWLDIETATREPSFCLDIIDILLNEWWNSDESVAEVNELFADHWCEFKVVDRRVEQAELLPLRRTDQKIRRSDDSPRSAAFTVSREEPKQHSSNATPDKPYPVAVLAYHGRVCKAQPYEQITRELIEGERSFTNLPKLVYYWKRALQDGAELCPICGSAPPPRRS